MRGVIRTVATWLLVWFFVSLKGAACQIAVWILLNSFVSVLSKEVVRTLRIAGTGDILLVPSCKE